MKYHGPYDMINATLEFSHKKDWWSWLYLIMLDWHFIFHDFLVLNSVFFYHSPYSFISFNSRLLHFFLCAFVCFISANPHFHVIYSLFLLQFVILIQCYWKEKKSVSNELGYIWCWCAKAVFCQIALPTTDSEINNVDFLGRAWKCLLNFGQDKNIVMNNLWWMVKALQTTQV